MTICENSTKPGGATIGKHSYTYDSFGIIASCKREAPLANPTGLTRQFDSKVFYDRADQVSSVIHTPLAGSSVVESAQHYVYDAAGNIVSRQIETPAAASTMTTYSHNNLNQLTGIGGSTGVKTVVVRGNTSESATVKVKPSIANVWKDARMLDGNRFESDLDLATGANQLNIQAKDGSNNVSNYTYALNLAAASAAVPSHDDDGNMLSDGVRSYDWDSLSRLTRITWGAGSVKTTEYRYNALGQRSERIEKAGTTETAHYYNVYDGIHLLTRFNGGTTTSDIDRQYLAQGEQRILTINNQPSTLNFYYNRDHLGSIREVMNSDGTLAARYDYDPYGKRSVQYQSSGYTGGCDLGYTGHISQQSPVNGQGEIVLTQFRAYDPELGRWLSTDPMGEGAGINLYGYGPNNPINGFDPTGGVWHHLIPFTGGLDAGLSPSFINSASNGWDLSQANHDKLHAAGSNWTTEWDNFFKKGNVTCHSATKQLNKMMMDPKYKKVLKTGTQALIDYPNAGPRMRKYYKSRMVMPGVARASIGLSAAGVLGAYSVSSSFLDAAESYIQGGEWGDQLTAMAIIAEGTNAAAAGYIETALQEHRQAYEASKSTCP